MKTVIHIVLFLCFIFLCSGENNLNKNELNAKQKKSKGNRVPKTCSASNIDVRLEKLSKFFKAYDHKGFVHISLPSFKRPLNLCFPKDRQEHVQVFLLSHILCRQLGFMTFANIQEKRIHMYANGEEGTDTTSTTQPPLESLRPTSWVCKGHENAISQCQWNNIETEACDLITEVACGNCQRTMTNLEDTIKIPGYPSVFLYDLTCEWRIEVPEAHSIFLEFDQRNAQPFDQSEFQCTSERFSIELIYGTQEKFSVYKYCDFREEKNLSIPYHSVTIRYFSGLYNPRDLYSHPKEQSLAISYKAVPMYYTPSFSWLVIMAAVLIAVIIGLGVTCYFCQKYNERRRDRIDIPQVGLPNAPGREDLERAYEFHRCQIQGKQNIKPGLRLRSNGGSRSRLSSIFRPMSSASDSLVSVFRKISSQAVTPRTIIPEILFKGQYSDDGKHLMISKCKTNLVDRFSTSTSNDCSDSSVFLPVEMEPNFQIYCSESSDYRPQPMQQNLHLHKETAI